MLKFSKFNSAVSGNRFLSVHVLMVIWLLLDCNLLFAQIMAVTPAGEASQSAKGSQSAEGSHPAESSHPAEGSIITILTNDWPPYINKETELPGSAARAMRILASEYYSNIHWNYLPYKISYDFVRRKKQLLSFPWFKTAKREKEVFFSEPVFSVTSYIYYNRRYHTKDEMKANWVKKKMGIVEGYSYGATLDSKIKPLAPKEYRSEVAALNALMKGEIDTLPMTEQVMLSTLKQYFPNRIELIAQVDDANAIDHSSLHLIAAKTAKGERVIERFNQALLLMKAKDNDIFAQKPLKHEEKVPEPDLAELLPAEGYPVILGQTSKNSEKTSYYVLPQGSKVLVFDWSEKILQANPDDRLYKSMVDLSHVVVLNGPHVGKELYVKNMHINLL